MRLRKRLLTGAVALTAGLLPFTVGIGSAHADTEKRDTELITFTSAQTGNSVTCSVEAYAVVFGAADDPRHDAYASLKSYGADPSCAEGSASLSATYRNNSGVQVRSGAGGDRAAYWTADDVGSGSPNLVVDHTFSFSDCLSNCSLTITTAPK